MLTAAYIVSFTGMILLPILAWIYFAHKFSLSWKLLLAGGLAFIASQIPHIPLTIVLAPALKSWSFLTDAIVLGLLAGLFEETARYILFKFILKKSRTWQEGIFVGLGHGGTEAIILGILAGVSFARMLALRNVDLATVPSIPADQLALARQQLAAFWSTPAYIAILGVVERIFAVCLHVSLSVMVLYGIAVNKPAWYGLAVLWHTIVDGIAAYLGLLKVNTLTMEGLIGLMAIASIGLVFALRGKFPAAAPEVAPMEINNP